MRWISILFLVALSALLGIAIRYDPGYVSVHYASWQLESPLWLLLLVLLLLGGCWHIVRYLVGAVVGLTDSWLLLSRGQRRKKANQETIAALLSYQKQDWLRSEGQFMEWLSYAEHPELNALYASYCAKHQGAYLRAHQHLDRVLLQDSEQHPLLLLAKAELFFDQQEWPESLALAQRLRAEIPKNVRLLRILQALYQHLGRWDELMELKKDLKSKDLLSLQEAHALDVALCKNQLTRFCDNPEISALDLRSVWHRLPSALRSEQSIMDVYLDVLFQLKAEEEAQHFLQEQLKKEWRPSLLLHVLRCKQSTPEERLSWLEPYVAEHEDEAALHHVLGMLCLEAQLWGKAAAYLEQALALSPQPNYALALGRLQHQMGQAEAALATLSQGLEDALVTQPLLSFGSSVSVFSETS